ncbi:MAG: hypothetical protein K2N78_02755 [Oscillospiraceae bacterium]|nr:hypothetical protein [Oscillospiraceae bacterium]
MTRDSLIKELQRIAVLDKFRCMGCGYEHSCSLRGCAIIKEAIEELRKMDPPSNPPLTLEELREMGLLEWLWVEVMRPTKRQLFLNIASAYY